MTATTIDDGSLNFFFGGSLGALVEASLPNISDYGEMERYQVAYYTAVFGTAGKMVSADGVVVDSELETVRQFIHETLRLDPDWERFALSLFSQAIESATPVENYLEQFAVTVKEDLEVGESFLNFLCAIAISDGEFHPEEKKILLLAESLLHQPEGSTAQILSQYGWSLDSCLRLVDKGDSLSRSYALLDLLPDATIEMVEEAFRQKTHEFSPQLATHKGYPAEFVKFANQRFQEICNAYTTIMSELRK